MNNWMLAFLEFGVVLAFGLGWAVLEWQTRRLDRKRAENSDRTNDGQSTDHEAG